MTMGLSTRPQSEANAYVHACLSQAVMATLVLHETETPRAGDEMPPSQPLHTQQHPGLMQSRSTNLSQVLSDEDIALVQLLRPGPFVPKAAHSSAFSKPRLCISTGGSAGMTPKQPVVNPNAKLRNSTGSSVAVQPQQPPTTAPVLSTSLLAPLVAGFQAGFNVGYCSGVVAGVLSGAWQQRFTGLPSIDTHAHGQACTSPPDQNRSGSQETIVALTRNAQSTNLMQHSAAQPLSNLQAPKVQAKPMQSPQQYLF